MVGGKTSSLFNACAEIGAILGGGSDEEINALGVFGWNAGIAFQLYDDILGATATEEILGKPVGSDFREGKKTLLMIHALEKASSKQKSIILNVLGNKEASKEEIKEVTDILYYLGSIDYVNEKAEYYIQKAMSSLSILPETDAKKDLKDLVDYFINRKN
jgi:geranylgeranyl diphosphate synthase type I